MAHFTLRRLVTALSTGGLIFSSSLLAASKPPADPLWQGFTTPPASAKPRVWWHWMNGNVTKEGIKADLDWMASVGIGGVQNFDAYLATPQIVDKRITYMTPKWSQMFDYALQQAKSHNMEFAIAASPGWSETGGPWVAAKDGMKKLVWSETLVSAAQLAKGPLALAAPPQTTGAFQDVPVAEEMFGGNAPKAEHPHYYGNIAVLALPADEVSSNFSKVTTSDGKTLDATTLHDGKYATQQDFVTKLDSPYWLQFDYPKAQSFQSASLAMPAPPMFVPASLQPELWASSDGKQFTKVATFPASSGVQSTVRFAPVNAKALRIVFASNPNSSFSMPSDPAPGAAKPPFIAMAMNKADSVPFSIMELGFYGRPKVHHFEEKAGYAIANEYYPLNQGATVAGTPASEVIDLTDKLDADGKLHWQPKQGNWRIIRLGYSLTGKENHPATPEATGLEVDKFDADAVSRYINTYLDNYVNALGGRSLKDAGISALLNDSIEVGASNWTPELFSEFKQRRGYDLHPWLPALTGEIINDSAQTDAFLYDFRHTLAELIADNHYAVISDAAHKRGLKHYSEALENGRPVLGDGMAMRKHADVPMAAMWSFSTDKAVGPKPQYWSDIREAASVAHIYGQNTVAAESLTSALSPWAFSPADLQPMIDMEFALGVNLPIIHTSVHQPLTNKAPGLSLLVFGQFFNRLETWAPYAKPWVDYIARNAFMLQQGRFAADVAYFYGEEAPLTGMHSDTPPTDVPKQNGFDYVNADVILTQLKVTDGKLTADSGASYKALYLGDASQFISLKVLQQLSALVQQGATLIGPQPKASPQLQDDQQAFTQLATALWQGKTGKGKVIAADSVQTGLDQAGIKADFAYQSANADSTIMFVHRVVDDKDIYYYTNRHNRAEPVTFSFAVSGKQPMHWDANTGQATPLSYQVKDGVTQIARTLAPFESGYVVFERPTSKAAFTAPQAHQQVLTSLTDNWQVSFQPGRGAPEKAVTLAVGDLAKSADDSIKYFSGTATYNKELMVEKAWLKGDAALTLDLGKVGDVADVLVNGQSAGIVWKAPYQTQDLRALLKPGANTLEIKVTNLWVNRLIGDKQPDAKQTYTFTTMDTYEPTAPLRPSGLLMPVKLVQSK